MGEIRRDLNTIKYDIYKAQREAQKQGVPINTCLDYPGKVAQEGCFSAYTSIAALTGLELASTEADLKSYGRAFLKYSNYTNCLIQADTLLNLPRSQRPADFKSPKKSLKSCENIALEATEATLDQFLQEYKEAEAAPYIPQGGFL